MPKVLITGANRGIGKSLSENFLADGWEVIGTCRDLSSANNEQISWKQLEVTDEASIAALKDDLGEMAIDVLWNNAGVYLDRGQSLSELTNDKWLETFAINTIAPLRLAEALRENVAASDRKVMAFTSSRMGSITQNTGGAFAYRSSKTALNMAVNCLSQDRPTDGISYVVLHPGWVRTDMGGSNADIDVETSAKGMKKVVENITPALQKNYNGSFINYDGSPLPW